MFIADAQVHIWAPNTPERPWRTGQPVHREAPLGADELLREMNAAGVSRTVLVPPYWEGDRHDVVLDAARQHPGRFAVMARPDTEAPGPTNAFIALLDQPGVMGVRCSFVRPRQISTLEQGDADWLWKLAEDRGLPVMTLVPHAALHVIEKMLDRHPRLKLALCHLGLTSDEYDEIAFRDFDKLLTLARQPNVSVKISALPAYTKDRYPYRRLHPYLRRVYDAFGPQRMFWGTDIARMPCTYRQAVTMYTEEIPWLSNCDKAWIMGHALCDWLAWEIPESGR